MSNLSVSRASEAAIGIATLRRFASTATEVPSLAAMAPEILGSERSALTIRATIQTLAEREHGWIKGRATHATISDRVNERRGRELDSMSRVCAAALSTVELGSALRTNDRARVEDLQESFITAMRGIDEFPMGVSAKQALKSQLVREVELALPEASRERAGTLLADAEIAYLKRYADAVYANYDQPDPSSSPSM